MMRVSRPRRLGRFIIVGGALLSTALLLIADFRWSALWLAVSLLALSVWRLREPEPSSAWFVVRSRGFDVTFLAILALALSLLAFWVPSGQ